MLRRIFTAICTGMVLAPAALIEAAERVALENPGACERRSWAVPGARIEGGVFLGLLWWSEDSYSAFKNFLGLVGLLVLVFPRAYVNYGSEIAYTETSSPEWKPWVYTGTRLVGVLYVITALRERRND